MLLLSSAVSTALLAMLAGDAEGQTELSTKRGH